MCFIVTISKTIQMLNLQRKRKKNYRNITSVIRYFINFVTNSSLTTTRSALWCQQTKLYNRRGIPKAIRVGTINHSRKMKKDLIFSASELTVLEALEVRGGQSELQTIQNQCPNNVTGCACTVVLQPSTSTQQQAGTYFV